MKSLLIKGGRVIDPANNIDAVRDVLIVDGKIASPTGAKLDGIETIDATGKIVTPGLLDIFAAKATVTDLTALLTARRIDRR